MELFKLILFSLCVVTSFACTTLLFRAYARRRYRLLMWSAICFAGLTVNNLFLFVDLVIFPTQIDLRLVRLFSAFGGLLFLLYGFIWDTE